MQKNLPDSFEHEQNVIDFAGLYLLAGNVLKSRITATVFTTVDRHIRLVNGEPFEGSSDVFRSSV